MYSWGLRIRDGSRKQFNENSSFSEYPPRNADRATMSNMFLLVPLRVTCEWIKGWEIASYFGVNFEIHGLEILERTRRLQSAMWCLWYDECNVMNVVSCKTIAS